MSVSCEERPFHHRALRSFRACAHMHQERARARERELFYSRLISRAVCRASRLTWRASRRPSRLSSGGLRAGAWRRSIPTVCASATDAVTKLDPAKPKTHDPSPRSASVFRREIASDVTHPWFIFVGGQCSSMSRSHGIRLKSIAVSGCSSLTPRMKRRTSLNLSPIRGQTGWWARAKTWAGNRFADADTASTIRCRNLCLPCEFPRGVLVGRSAKTLALEARVTTAERENCVS